MSSERSLREMMSLDGRVAVITGGAGHIGRAIAAGLAELGASIALVDIAASPGAEAAAKLTASHAVKAAMFECDFEQGDAVKELPRRVREALGGVDIIVNCAAFVGTSRDRTVIVEPCIKLNWADSTCAKRSSHNTDQFVACRSSRDAGSGRECRSQLRNLRYEAIRERETRRNLDSDRARAAAERSTEHLKHARSRLA